MVGASACSEGSEVSRGRGARGEVRIGRRIRIALCLGTQGFLVGENWVAAPGEVPTVVLRREGLWWLKRLWRCLHLAWIGRLVWEGDAKAHRPRPGCGSFALECLFLSSDFKKFSEVDSKCYTFS